MSLIQWELKILSLGFGIGFGVGLAAGIVLAVFAGAGLTLLVAK